MSIGESCTLRFLSILGVLAGTAMAQEASPEPPRAYCRFPAIHGDQVVFTAEGDLWRVPVTGGTAQRITTHPGTESHASISPDGRWLAYAEPAANSHRQIQIAHTTNTTRITLTSDRTDSSSPTWSHDGKWIYFLSDRRLRSLVSSPWGLRQPEPFFTESTLVFGIALQPGLRWPFKPTDELSATEATPKDSEKPKDTPAPAKPDDANASTNAPTSLAAKPSTHSPTPKGVVVNIDTDQHRLAGMLARFKQLFGTSLAFLTGVGVGVMKHVSELGTQLNLMVGSNYLENADQNIDSTVGFYQMFQGGSRHMRQRWFEVARFHLFCIGGVGTLEEIGLTLTDIHLGLLNREPIIFFGRENHDLYWNALAAQLGRMVESGRAPRWITDNMLVTDNPDEAIAFYQRVLQIA